MIPLIHNISLKDKILFYDSIANLLDGGVTLLSALKWFSARLHDSTFKEAVDNTIFFVEWGDTMNVAMRKVPNFYSSKEIAIIEAGEQTWMLRTTFSSIAEELRTEEDLKRKVVWAMVYPIIILFFLVLAFLVIMVYVVPQIIPIITETGTNLSFAMRSLIFLSDFFRENIIFLLIFLIALWFIFQWYIRTDTWRRWIDKEKIYFPIFGEVYKNYLIVQTMATFHLLISSGVSIMKTLQLTWASSGNSIVEDMYRIMGTEISHGKKIYESMRQVDEGGMIFSADILQMVESAERTSTMDTVSKKISEQYKREVDASLANMVKFIEPVALLLAGGFVLWFAIAIFSSIMQVVSVSGL